MSRLVCLLGLLAACRFEAGRLAGDGGELDGTIADARAPDAGPDAALDATEQVVDAAPPDGAPPVDAPPGCPSDWQAASGTTSTSTYLVVDQPRAWWDAEFTCVQLGLVGGAATHLAVVDSDQEARALAALGAPDATYWIGLVQDPEAGFPWTRWQKLTGGGAVVTWRLGQPDDKNVFENGDENFVELDHAGNMNDLDGASARRAICECDGRPQAPDVRVQAPHG